MTARKESALRRALLTLAVSALRSTPRNRLPSVPALMLFAAAWGNYGYSGTVRLLRHICRTMRRRSSATILECGSGASTLLMGILARRYNCRVISLEHDAAWALHMQTLLQRFGLERANVFHAPLRSYGKGEYQWYTWPTTLTELTFSVVVCDGPPARTPGGRFGLLPVVESSLADDCLIILDDTQRRSERETIARWRERCSLHTRSHLALKWFTEIALLPHHADIANVPPKDPPMEGMRSACRL